MLIVQSIKLIAINLIIGFCCLSFVQTSLAQVSTDISAQLQIYPTGVIPGIALERSISDRGRIAFRIGYNSFDHRDLGVQSTEVGGGAGFSVGYQHYFTSDFRALNVEIKNDFWFNSVDWTNAETMTEGKTNITVLQPTAIIGYTILTSSDIVIRPTVGFGWEWNVRTEGEPTGEGAIGLIGISVGKRL
jgi:hypothetical protein